MSVAMTSASSTLVAVPPAGCAMSSSRQRAFQRSRSSARSIDDGGVPSTSDSGSTPASFSGVCPPSETTTPTTRPSPTLARCSTSMTFETSSALNGSKYRRSDVS